MLIDTNLAGISTEGLPGFFVFILDRKASPLPDIDV